MGTDGKQKHLKSVENMGRNSFSTLAGTLALFIQTSAETSGE
jgi:hypothetical protein